MYKCYHDNVRNTESTAKKLKQLIDFSNILDELINQKAL